MIKKKLLYTYKVIFKKKEKHFLNLTQALNYSFLQKKKYNNISKIKFVRNKIN